MATEKRLIDADALVAHFRKTKIDEVFPNWKELNPIATSAVIRITTKYRAIVLSAPTVDAVEVARCKDCRYRIHDKVTNEWFCNSLHSGFVYAKPNDFCSYGERKDNE